MPMKALCGAASPCHGPATVRQLPTRGEWWEAADCVEHTERVLLFSPSLQHLSSTTWMDCVLVMRDSKVLLRFRGT
jgi:hypothetical protein